MSSFLARNDARLHALVYGLAGAGGGLLTACATQTVGEPAGMALLISTALLSAGVGLVISRLAEVHLGSVLLACMAGGALNGAIDASLVAGIATAPLAAAIGVLFSFAFVPPYLYLAIALRRLRSAREASLLRAAYVRSVWVTLLACLGGCGALVCVMMPRALRFDGGMAPFASYALAATWALAMVLHLRDHLHLGYLLRAQSRLRATLTPSGVRARDFVDVGTGDTAYEAVVSDGGLRGAPEVHLLVAGDAAAARGSLQEIAIIDATALALAAWALLV